MSVLPDPMLLLSLAIVGFAIFVFGWRVVSTGRAVHYAVTESRVPRRWLLLGLAGGFACIYWLGR